MAARKNEPYRVTSPCGLAYFFSSPRYPTDFDRRENWPGWMAKRTFLGSLSDDALAPIPVIRRTMIEGCGERFRYWRFSPIVVRLVSLSRPRHELTAALNAVPATYPICRVTTAITALSNTTLLPCASVVITTIAPPPSTMTTKKGSRTVAPQAAPSANNPAISQYIYVAFGRREPGKGVDEAKGSPFYYG
jgi:hypothetical protein